MWTVILHDEFEAEIDQLAPTVRNRIFMSAGLIEEHGPSLGRPHVDTVKGSDHANMKELRVSADRGVWRVMFAFDPERKAVLLVAADKRGKDQSKVYKNLIKVADQRFTSHLETLE